jgi:hypothetical protein
VTRFLVVSAQEMAVLPREDDAKTKRSHGSAQPPKRQNKLQKSLDKIAVCGKTLAGCQKDSQAFSAPMLQEERHPKDGILRS